jgi:hypothetical protein
MIDDSGDGSVLRVRGHYHRAVVAESYGRVCKMRESAVHFIAWLENLSSPERAVWEGEISACKGTQSLGTQRRVWISYFD